MKRLNLFGFLAVLLLFSACQPSNKSKEQLIVQQMAPKKTTADQQVIVSGKLTFETPDIIFARKQAKIQIGARNGYIEYEAVERLSDRIKHHLIIRVPSQHFTNLQDSLARLAKVVVEKSVYRQDISDQFIDLEARLNTARLLEARYLDMMGGSRQLEEVMKMEKELNKVRQNIEKLEGELKELGKGIQYAYLQLEMYEKVMLYGRFKTLLLDGLNKGIQRILELIIWLANYWPIVLVLLISGMVYAVFRFRKKKKKKDKKKKKGKKQHKKQEPNTNETADSSEIDADA